MTSYTCTIRSDQLIDDLCSLHVDRTLRWLTPSQGSPVCTQQWSSRRAGPGRAGPDHTASHRHRMGRGGAEPGGRIPRARRTAQQQRTLRIARTRSCGQVGATGGRPLTAKRRRHAWPIPVCIRLEGRAMLCSHTAGPLRTSLNYMYR